MKHGMMMLIGCGGSVLLLLLLPAFGVSLGISFVVAFALMIGCHLFMGHDMSGNPHAPNEHENEKDAHEHH